MHALGFDVPALEVSLPADERISNTANDVLNKYTVHSILNEIRWGLKPGEAFPEEAYLQIDEERWHDPHLAGNLKPASLARIRERRAIVSKLYGELKRCRIVVITLGVIETWYDTLTDLYLNEAPPVSSVRRYPGRFRMDVLSTTDTAARLDDIHDLLAAHGHPDFRMLITVSPVPLKSTFTTKDVIQANTYSKSTLRAAVESFVNAHERVDYFPSYEIVTHTLRDAAYIEDNRHVAVEVVSTVVDRMVGAYCHSTRADDDEVMTPSQARTIRSEIRNLHRKEENDKVAKLLGKLRESDRYALAGYSEYEFRFEYGRALARVGSYVAADLQLSRAASLAPSSAVAAFQVGITRFKLHRTEDALTWLKRANELDPELPGIVIYLGRVLIEAGREAEAERILSELVIKHPANSGAQLILQQARSAAFAEHGDTLGASASGDTVVDRLLHKGKVWLSSKKEVE